MDESSSDSEWDYFQTILNYQGTVADIKKVASSLRRALPNDEVEIEILFESFSMLQKFEKKLQLEHEVFSSHQRLQDKNDVDYLWRQLSQKSKTKKHKDFQKLTPVKLSFKNFFNVTAFYLHFESRIISMETEYNYFITLDKRNLSVYLRNPYEKQISSFFINEIFEMKNSLKILVQSNKEIFTKAKYSKWALQKLEKLNIKTIIHNRLQLALFYSEKFPSTYAISREVFKVLSYHISVIKFPQTHVDNYIVQEIFKLIYIELRPVLAQIERSYEMPVEIDFEKAAFVITDFHQIFNDGVQAIKQNLSILKIIEIQCQSIIQLRRILQKHQYLSLVKYNYIYRKCFLLFSDYVTKKQPKLTQKLCEEIATTFRNKYKLIVHLVHLYQDLEKLTSESQRILKISEKYHLNVLTFHKFSKHRDYNKIVIEPVQLGIYEQQYRQKQIKFLLQDLVLNKTTPENQFDFYILADEKSQKRPLDHEYGKEKSNISCNQGQIFDYVSYNQKSRPQEQKCNSDDSNKKLLLTDSNSIIRSLSNYQFITLSIPFEYPIKNSFEENLPMKRGKRQRALQDLMENHWTRKLRIWKIILHSTVKLSKLKYNDRIQIVVSNIFLLKQSHYKLKNFSEVMTKQVNEFKEGERGFISFVDLHNNVFIPSYEIQFVD